MNKKEKAEIESLLDSIPNEFRVIENKIDAKVMEEYYTIAESLEDKTQDSIIINKNNQTESSSKDDIKKLLVRLSKIGDVKSYRKIEEIIESCKPEILDFSCVALNFARLNLESNLSDEPVGFISTALGGKGKKLRYYFIVTSKERIDEDKELEIIRELNNICIKDNSELEEIENHGNYMLVKILVSMDFAIGNVIDKLTGNCSFLDKEYMCTNLEKPTKEFVKRWMNGEFD